VRAGLYRHWLVPNDRNAYPVDPFWFLSAACRLPTIKPGLDEIDNVELSKVLHRMSRWNFSAAGLMGVTALLAALARYFGRVSIEHYPA
jgi:hypothetical protein